VEYKVSAKKEHDDMDRKRKADFKRRMLNVSEISPLSHNLKIFTVYLFIIKGKFVFVQNVTIF